MEVMRLFKAIEFLYKGVDISTVSKKDYVKFVGADKSLSTVDDGAFAIALSPEVVSFIDYPNPYIVREGNTYHCIIKDELVKMKKDIDTTIEYPVFIALIKTLKQLGIDSYNSIDDEVLDPDFKSKMEDIDRTWDYTKAPNCDIKKKLSISAVSSEVKTLLALADYPCNFGGRLYDYYKENHQFAIDAFKDFEVVDNRIIIPLSPVDIYNLKKDYKKQGKTFEGKEADIKAIVISKNVLDYFYCSYGNEFQSCFSLNSDSGYWYGYVPFAMTDESCIIYGTTGDVAKTAVISGTKYHNPNMLFRCWGYTSDDNRLIIDRVYQGNNASILSEFCRKLLRTKFNAYNDVELDDKPSRNLLNDGKGIYGVWNETAIMFYSDSLLKKTDKVTFKYSGARNGTNSDYKPEWRKKYNTFITYAKTVMSVSPTLDPSKPSTIINGVLLNPKTCPITSLYIDDTIDKHPYARYFEEPVTSLAILTYINGTVFTEYASMSSDKSEYKIKIDTGKNYTRTWREGCLWVGNYASSGSQELISLKTLKELIKGEIPKLPYNAILLKTIENDKISMQVFKNKGK